jgi:hypothetical protein
MYARCAAWDGDQPAKLETQSSILCPRTATWNSSTDGDVPTQPLPECPGVAVRPVKAMRRTPNRSATTRRMSVAGSEPAYSTNQSVLLDPARIGEHNIDPSPPCRASVRPVVAGAIHRRAPTVTHEGE